MIDSFSGEYRFLSNFYPSEIRYKWLTYPTVEHAYQAAKVCDYNHRFVMARMRSIDAGLAKRIGRISPLRFNWEQLKVPIMFRLLQLKFVKDSELATRLCATWPHELVEGNTWGDTFWGVCNGTGRNMLGQLLEARRNELQLELV